MDNSDALKIVIVVSDTIPPSSNIIQKTVSQLKQSGVAGKDIDIFHVPTDLDIVYGCSVVYDHLLRDGTIAISSEYNTMVAQKLIDLQVECDYPTEYRWAGMTLPERSGIVGMIEVIEDVLIKESFETYEEDPTPELQPSNKKKKSTKVN